MGCVTVKLILDLWISILYTWDMKNRKDNMFKETTTVLAIPEDLMIVKLQEQFNLNAVPMEEWEYGRDNGIWIRDDICKKETDYYPYAEGTMDDSNILNKFLSANGWYAQPYDSETIMIYEI